MKVISMYLPQFHIVPENSKWWGDGFTDWVSTRNAEPLFDGHYQPHVPLNENYYDLMEKEVMIWQAELMHKYGIDGQCFYHYWFEDGKRILEKPAENLLAWKDVNMPYCFCWANETWARSWSGLHFTNTWSDIGEPVKREGEKAILLKQSYGNREAWTEHFDYLLPFFKDERYIKYEGKPVFLIYRSSEIYCLEEMVDWFNKLAVQNGYEGIYFICANSAEELPDNVDGVLIHEPQNSILQLSGGNIENSVSTIDYEQCWKKVLQSRSDKRSTYFEGFVSYDDTPRRGINGTVIKGANPECFERNIEKLFAKSQAIGNEFVFINAWNEWGEGMHLEPDEKWGYAYLESISRAKVNCKNISVEFGVEETIDANVEKIKNQRKKFEKYLNVLDEWMTLREKGVFLYEYFKKYGYNRIAIYGYSLFAKHLLYELESTDVEVSVLIDKQKDKIRCEIPVIHPEEKLPNVDVVVVTSFFFLKDIKNHYKKQNIRIISLESIIKEIMRL